MPRLALLLIMLAAPTIASSQDAERSEFRPPDEEITVLGRQSLSSMRLDVQKALEDFYALFNRLNDDDKHDIDCRREQVLGTPVPQRLCFANHEREAYSQSARMHFLGGTYLAARDAESEK